MIGVQQTQSSSFELTISFEDCCLTYRHIKYPRRVQKRIITFREQNTGAGCNLHAIVLELKSATICVNPNEKWVKDYINPTTMKKNEKGKTRCLDHLKRCRHRQKY
ncbi:C-C motif chemokine 14 [Heterodontus francisci]|uniref:C-C motif chemokine 14 n=1 Tax=Heterodontus francisci TaxID=7792 RepID=UPI00355AED65